MSKRNIITAVGAIALAIGWYAFRPELLFISKQVNEQFPTGSQVAAGPTSLAKGNFKSLAHETKGLATIYKLAGESINYGTEQEHLNNVAGARLHISGLKATIGPGIEFLEYLTPRDGRPAPRDTKANDLWHWQTTLTTDNAASAAQKLRAVKRRVVSPAVAEIAEKSLGFKSGFLARDADGHGLQFVEK